MKAFFIILASLFSHGHFKQVTPTQWQHFNDSVYLQNNDSIQGEILLYLVSGEGLVIPANVIGVAVKGDSAADKAKHAQWINYKNIRTVSLLLPEEVSPLQYQYIPSQKTICRVLRKNDSTCIYSNSIMPRLGLQYAPKHLILQCGSKSIRMYSGFSWLFHNSKTKPLLKNFINKRYKTSFKKDDFKDEDDELNYIINHG